MSSQIYPKRVGLVLGLAGLGAFILFFLVAVLNAVVIGVLGSIASIGVLTTFVSTSLIAVYVGALIVAFLSISMITVFCICAAFVVVGGIAFLWILWRGWKKGVETYKALQFMPITSFTREGLALLSQYTSGSPSQRELIRWTPSREETSSVTAPMLMMGHQTSSQQKEQALRNVCLNSQVSGTNSPVDGIQIIRIDEQVEDLHPIIQQHRALGSLHLFERSGDQLVLNLHLIIKSYNRI